MSDRPRIGVSACLLGEPVRYDGAHKRDSWLVDVLGRHVEWVPICPEVEAGLGTPREPMRLERGAGGGVAVMGVETRREYTPAMRRYAEEKVEEIARADLDGYVFKAGSPSCGPSVSVFPDEEGRGVFADAVMERFPDLPCVDERMLADAAARHRFVERVSARHRARGDGAAPSAFATVDVVRGQHGERDSSLDRVAIEEPLEVRLHGQPFAVIMRTPGADRELASGFLLAERVIRDSDDLGAIEYCRTVAPAGSADSMAPSTERNIVNVTLTNRSTEALEQLLADRRNTQTSASCGLCGRRTIESLTVDVPPISATTTISTSVLSMLPGRLRACQTVFDETGGLHAAGLFAPDGDLVDIAEDVGRHNAVDKIVGRMLMLERLPLSDRILFVSGRASFEIVQKALFAGIPIVAAVSAPSSLAIDLAKAVGITLIGFVRGDSHTAYAHVNRVIG